LDPAAPLGRVEHHGDEVPRRLPTRLAEGPEGLDLARPPIHLAAQPRELDLDARLQREPRHLLALLRGRLLRRRRPLGLARPIGRPRSLGSAHGGGDLACALLLPLLPRLLLEELDHRALLLGPVTQGDRFDHRFGRLAPALIVRGAPLGALLPGSRRHCRHCRHRFLGFDGGGTSSSRGAAATRNAATCGPATRDAAAGGSLLLARARLVAGRVLDPFQARHGGQVERLPGAPASQAEPPPADARPAGGLARLLEVGVPGGGEDGRPLGLPCRRHEPRHVAPACCAPGGSAPDCHAARVGDAADGGDAATLEAEEGVLARHRRVHRVLPLHRRVGLGRRVRLLEAVAPGLVVLLEVGYLGDARHHLLVPLLFAFQFLLGFIRPFRGLVRVEHQGRHNPVRPQVVVPTRLVRFAEVLQVEPGEHLGVLASPRGLP